MRIQWESLKGYIEGCRDFAAIERLKNDEVEIYDDILEQMEAIENVSRDQKAEVSNE